MRDVTPARLAMWLEKLKGAGVGGRTVEIAGITAHKMFKSALDRELISRNPCDNSAVREARPKAKAKAKAKAKVPTVWTAEETRAFLDSQRDDRLFALWRLANDDGPTSWRARRFANGTTSTSTLAPSAWSHTFAVRRLPSPRVEPKTEKSRRTIGLDPATVAALKTHRMRQSGGDAYDRSTSDR